MQPAETQPCSQHSAVEALARDRLKPPEREPVIRHLERCTVCRNEFRKLTAAWFPHLDTYTIVARVASGGFGTVYRAVHHAKERTEALKVLHVRTPIHAAYFENEVHLIAQLRHPNIATLYEAQLATPPLYYTMEFVSGQRLNDYVHKKAVSLAERVRIVRTVAEAVGHAHAQGVVHRDLKPQNILIDADGRPHIVDFGIAKRLGLATLTPAASSSPDAEMDGPIGTFGYMAPEQIHGRAVDGRADVFALGALLFTTLTGEPARLARDPAEVVDALQGRQARQPKDLAAIIARCVDEDPGDRYPTCAALVDDLDRYLDGRPVTARHDEAAGYRAARVAGWVMHRHPGAIRAAIVVIAAFSLSLTMAALDPYWLSPPSADGRVVIVAFDERTLAALQDGDLANVVPGANATDRKTWRLLHARLLERLSPARPSVIAWDYFVPKCVEEVDGPFVQAIRQSLPPVIFGADRFDEGGRPNLCSAYRDVVDGCGAILSTPLNESSYEFDVPLCILRGFEEPIPSLALSALAAVRAPDAQPELRVEGARALHVRYRKSQSAPEGARWLALRDKLPLSSVQEPPGETAFLQAGDRLAHVRVPIAATADWATRTVSYLDVLVGDEAQLQRWFRDRAVLVGQMLSGSDEHKLADDRTAFGCIVHAQTLDTLMSRQSEPLTRPELALRIVGWCVLGGWLASRARFPAGRWLGKVGVACAVLALTGMVLAACFAAFVHERVGLEAAIAVCSILTAGSLILALHTIEQRQLQLAPQNVVPPIESDTVPTTALVDAGSTATR